MDGQDIYYIALILNPRYVCQSKSSGMPQRQPYGISKRFHINNTLWFLHAISRWDQLHQLGQNPHLQRQQHRHGKNQKLDSLRRSTDRHHWNLILTRYDWSAEVFFESKYVQYDSLPFCETLCIELESRWGGYRSYKKYKPSRKENAKPLKCIKKNHIPRPPAGILLDVGS